MPLTPAPTQSEKRVGAVAPQSIDRDPAEWRVVPAIKPAAEFFSLHDVTLGSGPFADARAENATYLLSLDPDRLLHGFRQNAGLAPKAASYGGWEAKGLDGHTLGHYLTACAWMVESGDVRFRAKLDYVISELARCQEVPARHGLVSAIPKDEEIFAAVAKGDLRVQRFNLNGGWVPWYNLHKLFAGLRDAHVHGGNAQALIVMSRLGDWVDRTTGGLTDAQFQRMLYAEQGGMNEVLADLYALTGEERYLKLSRRFCDQEILGPLELGEDHLDGFHANTQIPKLVGAARLHQLTGDAALGQAAETFWRAVVDHRSWVTGGNSEAEHFFPVAQNALRLTASTEETCNTYNMLRLTEQLYEEHPAAERFDFFERALYNHILGSIDPATGQCTYFVSLRPGFFKYYGNAEDAFWCCTGSGLENHTKYALGIYAHDGDRTLWVNLFIPSILDWKSRGVQIDQRTRFPEESATTLVLHAPSPVTFALKLRQPAWLSGPAPVTVNGAVQRVTAGVDGYLTIEREWHEGDRVAMALPMKLRLEPLAQADNIVALLYGPLVLAGELGSDGLKGIDLYPPGENTYRNYSPPPAPVLAAPVDQILSRLEPVAGQPLVWKSHDLVRPADVTFKPFYAVHHERYVVYWTRLNVSDWTTEEKRRGEAAARETALATRTTDDVVCGEQQLEMGHAFKGDRSDSPLVFGRTARTARAGGWFEYRLAVDPAQPMELLCTWWGGDDNRAMQILVDGQVVATPRLNHDAPDAAFSTSHVVPREITRGKSQVTVRIQSEGGARTGQLFTIRALRMADQTAENL